MTIQQRKEREREEKRGQILSAAAQILAEEGIEGLSIRKIAAKIEYSPAMVYRYFIDKDAILSHLLQESYRALVQALVETETIADPVERLKASSRRYIDNALTMPDSYLSIMLGASPGVLEHTSVLFEGAAAQRQAVGMLCGTLKEMNPEGSLDDKQIELTAQVIWASTFGLTARLIIERDLPEEQRQRLIARHGDALVAIARAL